MGRFMDKLIGRDPHNDVSRLDVLDGVGRDRCETILGNIAERRLTAGIPQQRPVPRVGDRVTVSWWVGDEERTLDGWLLPSRPGWVRLANSPDDDGTGPVEDFMRAAFLAEDVQVTSW
jgi:hypothetical protein